MSSTCAPPATWAADSFRARCRGPRAPRRPSRLRSAVCLLAWLAAAAGPLRAEAPGPRAGFAEVLITPRAGITLAGRGCGADPSDGTLDPLMAQATVLADRDDQRLVIVSLDLIGLPPTLADRARSEVAAALHVPPPAVVINCSHTHSAPLLHRETLAGCGPPRPDERAYADALPGALAALCRHAADNLAPVAAEVRLGRCDLAIVRSGSGAQGMRPCPDGPQDPSVWILRLAAPDGKTQAVLFSCACHPVIVKDVQPSKISADFPGAARRRLRETLGRHVHVQFLQGPAGNLRPRALADLNSGRFVSNVPDALDRTGRSLADAVTHALADPGRPVHLRLAAREDRVDLPRAEPPPRSLFEPMAHRGDTALGMAGRYWLDQYDRGWRGDRVTRWRVGVVRLADDEWLCWLAGEPVVQWAERLRRWFTPAHVVALGYTQEGLGYLPVDEMLGEDVYEVRASNYYRSTSPAPLAPGVDAAVRAAVQAQRAAIASESSPNRP